MQYYIKFCILLGLYPLLEVASELQEIHYESSMRITGKTLTHVAVTLERIYMCMDYDAAKDEYKNKVEEFIKYVLIAYNKFLVQHFKEIITGQVININFLIIYSYLFVIIILE